MTHIRNSQDFQAAFGVSRETMEDLNRFVALLTKWNPKINLVAKSSLPDLWHRHIADSAQILTIVQQRKPDPKSWIDLGSGGGFPALICAILNRDHFDTQFHLVESDQRKSAFLSTVARELSLQVTIQTQRIETLPQAEHSVLTARALAPLDELLRLSRPLRAKSGLSLFLKGAQAQGELTAAQRNWNMHATTIPSLTAPDSSVILIEEFSHV